MPIRPAGESYEESEEYAGPEEELKGYEDELPNEAGRKLSDKDSVERMLRDARGRRWVIAEHPLLKLTRKLKTSGWT